MAGLVGTPGPHQAPATLGHGDAEVAPRIALVGDHDLAAAQGSAKQLERHLALGAVGPAQLGRPRRAVKSADKVQAHPPEKAGWLRLQP